MQPGEVSAVGEWYGWNEDIFVCWWRGVEELYAKEWEVTVMNERASSCGC